MTAIAVKNSPHFRVRQATEADIPELIELAHKIWRAHYPGIISAAQVEYMLADRYTKERLTKLIGYKNSLYLVAEDNARPVGRASLEPCPIAKSGDFAGGGIKGYCFITAKPGHGAFLDQCYVDPDVQGGGIGSMFMAEAVKFAKSGTLRLQVNRCNVGAINFYFRHGFTIERINELDIGGGYFMSDFIMVRPLSKAGEL